MAAITVLYRSSPPIITSTRIICATRLCKTSFLGKYTPYVVYLSSPTSGYHTKTRVRCKLLPTQNFSQFSTKPVHRNYSYFTNVLQKAFVVKAAEPISGTDASSSINGTILETGFSSDSSATSEAAIESITYIPPPPAPPEAILPPLNALGEPTLQSLGLGGWGPVGIIQNCLDFLHVTVDLPWWAAISLATLCIRMLIFPLVLTAQRNAAKMNNNLPQLQLLQMKMTEARNSGNQMESARLAQEMMIFMKEKNISPMKNVMVPLAQAPIFISMFMGLRGMANLPMESMKDGGLFWFVDLTLSDPYYLLPVVTACTMLATIELGTDGARLSSASMQNMKWVLRAMPLVVFPFTVNFPTAILCYWVSTNLISLVQVGFLKIPTVREYFKIPRLVTHKPETLPQKKKGMVEGFKESWSNMKVTKELEERERYDEMRFKKAGVGPVVRTFKHDPTKRKIISVKAKVKE